MNSSIKIVYLKWISLYDVQFRLHFWRKIKFTILAQFGWAKAVYVIKRPLARFLRTCHDRKPLKLEISWFKISLTHYGIPLYSTTENVGWCLGEISMKILDCIIKFRIFKFLSPGFYSHAFLRCFSSENSKFCVEI